MPDLSGKHGLIVGVANKRSIAWAIAQAASSAGARLALTYQGERLAENVTDLAATVGALVRPCAAFALKADLDNPFVQTTREGFRIAMDVSAYSLIALTRAAVPLMERRGGGSVITLTYLGSQRVFTNYNVMGVAKAALEATVRYLASDLGPRNIRVNAVSAGPIKTLAAAGIKDFSSIRNAYPERAPLRRNVEVDEVADAALFLLSPQSRGVTGEIVFVDAGYHVTGV
jgi:enoyl-[acyl-carrier protein] reductase I